MIQSQRTVLLTGASGFIGSALSSALSTDGWRVVGAGRRRPATSGSVDAWREFDLCSDAVPDGLFDDIDAFVHGAFVRQRPGIDGFAINVTAAERLLDAARVAGVGRAIFLSSLAAHPDALSQYGKQKYAIERLFNDHGFLSLRPGLVIGRGGLFWSLSSYLETHSYVPLIDGGRTPLFTVYIDDLAQIVVQALESNARGVYSVAGENPIEYRQFCKILAERVGVRPTFIAVPFWMASTAVAIAQSLRIPLPIDRDNLLGLRTMRGEIAQRYLLPGLRLRECAESIALFESTPC